MITLPSFDLNFRVQSLPFWSSGLVMAGVVFSMERLQSFESITPILFVLMIVVIALSSSLSSLRSGLVSAAIWAIYLIYHFFVPINVDVIPQSFSQAISEIALVLVLVLVQGRQKERHDRLTQALRQRSDQLDHKVRSRTIELAQANDLLKGQIDDRETTLHNLRQIEADLRQSEARLLLALQSSQMGIWDWDMTTGNITWSSGHEQLFGLEPNTFDGRYQTFDDRLHPDDRDSLNQAVDQAIHNHSTYHHEFRVVWEDGSTHWIAGKGRALYNDVGQAIRMTGTIVDIDDRKRMELALQKSQQRYQILTEVSPVGIFHTDEIGNCLYVNDRWSKIAGISASEALGEGWVKALYADDRSQISEAWSRSAQQHRPFRQEYRFQSPDGTITWVFGQAVAEKNSIGAVVGYVGTITDITDLKAAESQLRQLVLREQMAHAQALASRQQITNILESVTDGFVSLDADWRYIYVNRKAGEMLDRAPEALIGKNIWEVFPEGIGQPFYRAYYRAMAEQIPIQLEEYYPPWDRWFENRIYPSATGLAIFFQDTTDRKRIEAALQQANEGLELRVEERTAELTDVNHLLQQELQERQKAEKALRESQALLQAIIDNSPAVIYLVDAQNKILLVNRQHDRVFNLPSEHFVGKTIDEVFPSEVAATFNQRNQAVLKAGQPIESEDDAQHFDGTVHTSLSVRFPLFDEDGTAQMVCGICTDITERALIARLKEEFVSVVSHELRTPLTSIHGALNLLSEGLVEPQSEWGQRMIAIAANGADRLVRLVDDILDLERLDSGKISLSIQPCNLADLMTAAISLMQVMADQAQVTLSVSPLSVQLDADGDRVIQVLTNLLSNAIKFSPQGETGRLDAKLQDDSILVQVSDRGRGIAADQLEVIFDRFHQVDVSDARQKGGTGLGLAICRSIIQQHGGQIWAESTIGSGSQFSFTLSIARV
ncbi:PAS domain-containing sensor histidine kinase [Phormidesmis sp. 146-33]